MEFSFVYITTADIDESKRIGRALVEEKLAACANCIPHMESVYWWNGKLEQSCEAVLIAKTRSSQVEALPTRVKELHSYDVPCVVAMAIEGGNEEYLKWLGENTG